METQSKYNLDDWVKVPNPTMVGQIVGVIKTVDKWNDNTVSYSYDVYFDSINYSQTFKQEDIILKFK